MTHSTKKGYRVCKIPRDEDAPLCAHGPALLLEHIDCDGKVKERFYACAACRNRKDCSFYLKADSVETAEKKALRKQLYDEANGKNKCFYFHDLSDEHGIRFCPECSVLIPNDLCQDTKHINYYKTLTKDDMLYPTRWINAKKTNQTNAQYFFSEDAIDFVTVQLQSLGVKQVICLGAPSIHESLVSKFNSLQIHSFLLDIDVRLRQFYKDFAHYNMFNNHFFDDSEHKKFMEFLKGGHKKVLLVDPPYGGLLQALNMSINQVKDDFIIEYTLLFFPYYLEHQVNTFFTDLKMSDFKVDYSNHAGYRGGPHGKTRGSPARIFTDIPLKSFTLPADMYRFCKICEKYVSLCNQHCDKCNNCTTKDGPTYIHCDICNRCVKPSWAHCYKCDCCQLVGHECLEQKQHKDGCYLCGDPNHKRKDCQTEIMKNLKRRSDNQIKIRPYKRKRG